MVNHKYLSPRRVLKFLLQISGCRSLPPENFFYASFLHLNIYPKLIVFELTHRCNLRCVMCPFSVMRQDDTQKELSLDEIRRLIDLISICRVKPYVSVTGGEPFLRQDLFDILQYLELRRIKYCIFTNGTILNEDIIKKIAILRPDLFRFSIDGPREIHDEIRGSFGAFNKTVEMIRILKQKSNIRMLATCVIQALNTGYLEEVADTLENLSIDLCFQHLGFTVAEAVTRQKEIMRNIFGRDDFILGESDKGLEKFDISTLIRSIEKIRKKQRKIKITFSPDLSSDQIYKYYNGIESFTISDNCYFPWFSMLIDPYGNISVCRAMSYHLGNIKDENLFALYNNEKAKAFRGYIIRRLFPRCLRCAWCGFGDLLKTVF